MEMPAYLKSKTTMANTLFFAVISCLTAYGIPMKPELIALLSCAMNIALRYFTKEPMSSK